MRTEVIKLIGGSGEPELSPDVVQAWLITTDRAAETAEGLELLDCVDRLGIAAYAIYQTGEPGLLSKTYFDVSDHHPLLLREAVADIANAIVKDSQRHQMP